jgi:copper chaperone
MVVQSYEVVGMTCGHCVSSVTAAISAVEGVEHVDVDLGQGLVTVKAKYAVSEKTVAAAIVDAGYELVST